MTYKKKLIEVAIPLEDINKESAREKSIRHGHPSTLHLWWSRKPLATCRAVLFASLVDDPSAHPDKFPTEESQAIERERLFGIMRELVIWKNSNNEQVLNRARAEIMKSCDGNPPPVLDPFCGGGSIPLEAQRLGLTAYASDLNPVAVLITKAMIEIPPKFAGMPPVNPNWQRKSANEKANTLWSGAQGLADDVRYYGQWMRDEAEKRIGSFYPKVKLPKENGGGEATVIAWIWARTVKCPNPACGAEMPLTSKWELSKKAGKEAWIEPVIDPDMKRVDFTVKTGKGVMKQSPKTGRGAKFKCLVCGSDAEESELRKQFVAKQNGTRLLAIVAEGKNGRVYLPPNEEHNRIARSANPKWKPEEEMNQNTPNLVSGRGYGITHWHEIFTPRQLLALTTFSDLVGEARERVLADANAAYRSNPELWKLDTTATQDSTPETPIADGGTGPTAYADAVATYLAFGVDRISNTLCTIARWTASRDQTVTAFARQAIPMSWDYPEVNPFAGAAGDLTISLDSINNAIAGFETTTAGFAKQVDATVNLTTLDGILLSTDPPYYDNIGYADLSDFFYIWLRQSLKDIFPTLFSTLLTPKSQELVATPYRFDGNKEKAKEFFEKGLRKTFENMRNAQHPDYPMTVYYAFKQAETDEDDNGGSATASSGWETMLEGLVRSGLAITGTWPMRSELGNRMIATTGGGTNSLASSIVIACRARAENAPMTSRKDFIAELNRELPDALDKLIQGGIAPVDFAQAAIGPGMAIYTKYSRVAESSGEPMRVREALKLINQSLYEYLNKGDEELDGETQFALIWFEQFQYKEGEYGQAELLSKAKNVSVEGVVSSGIAKSGGGKVRLLKREEYEHEKWNPRTDTKLPAWELSQRLVYALEKKGVDGAAAILVDVRGLGETARELAYRLYSLCEKKGWATEAFAYNTLVTSWNDITRRAREMTTGKLEQMSITE